VKIVGASKIKCAVVSTLISLAFVAQAFAVLRPLFPIKPAAPSNGELIVIEDDLVLRSAKMPLMHHRGPATVASACDSRLFLVSAALWQISPRVGDTASIETHVQKDHFVERKPFSGSQFYWSTSPGSGFMKELVVR
jgi:hypothetical protein